MSNDLVRRSVEPPRRRRAALLAAALGCGAALGSAAAVGGALHDQPAPQAPPQVTVSAPAVTVAAPPIVVAPPAPVAAPEPPPAPPPRVTRPFLNADCILGGDEVPSRACNWDDGFPAVSADGKRVAMYAAIGCEQCDHATLYIRLLDVKTSRVIRDVLIHTEEEQAQMTWTDDDNDGKEYATATATRARVKRRAAAAQRILDAGGFRTLDQLGEVNWSNEQPEPHGTAVYAEIDEEVVRAIDPVSGDVLWQHRFEVPNRPGPDGDPDDDCGGFRFHGSTVWWEPTTRVVLVTQAYATGGCMCPVFDYQFVMRAP